MIYATDVWKRSVTALVEISAFCEQNVKGSQVEARAILI